MAGNIDEVVNSHCIQCDFVETREGHIPDKHNTELVIVKVYRSGKTEPLCKYVEMGCVVPRCNWAGLEGIGVDFPEDKLGICPYASKK